MAPAAGMVFQIYTPDEVLAVGLEIAGYCAKRQQTVQRTTIIKRFTDHFGVAPVVHGVFWEDLLTTTIPAARVDASNVSVSLANYLHSIWFIKRYQTESSRAG